LNPGVEKPAAANLAWKRAFLMAICIMMLCGCRGRQVDSGPNIEVTRVPLAEEGGPDKLDVIEGRVNSARHGLQVVLFARSGDWYVQPFANEPFTQIQSDSKWRSSTHLGTEYAALLVEPGFQPPASTGVLPAKGGGVLSVAIARGEPVFWQRWWFRLLCVLAFMSVLLAFYSYRLHQRTRQLNLRFEERLSERTQIAQELHDTLLQGVISASMQLHVAVDRVPEDLPAKPSLTHVLEVMGQVLEEGRNALQRLRSSASSGCLDLEQAFSGMQQELAIQQGSFRVTVEGRPRLVHPIIRDEVYRIGRQALINACRNSRNRSLEVEVIYKAKRLLLVLRDDLGDDSGGGASLVLGGDATWDLSEMRERAERMGARLKVRRLAVTVTEVELSVPGHVAFQSRRPGRPLRWLARLYPRTGGRGTSETEKGVSK
jgi:signal transduction histidine kinase